MKKLLFIFVVMLNLHFQSFSQKMVDSRASSFETVLDFQARVFLNPGYEKNNPNYKGSPYLNSDWESGFLTLNSGKKVEDLKLMYDVYNKSIYFTNGKDTASVGNPEIVKEIKLGSSTILYSSYLNENKVDKDYFEMLVTGEYKLLLHRSCKFLPAESTTQGYGQTEPAKFITDKTFYIKKADKPAIKVDKDDNFSAIFQTKKEEVESFIKENKLKPKKEQDLVKLVKFVNGDM